MALILNSEENIFLQIKNSPHSKVTTDKFERVCLSLVGWQLNAEAEDQKLSGTEHLEIP